MIPRFHTLSEKVRKGKMTILYGPRRVRKTRLLQEYINTLDQKPTLYTGEDLRIQAVMNSERGSRSFSSLEDIQRYSAMRRDKKNKNISKIS